MEFRELLASADFDKCFEHNNIDIIAKRWTETFLNIARTSIPNKVVTVRPNDSPWYTYELRLLKRKILRLFQKHKKKPK